MHEALTEPLRGLYSRMIVLAAAIVKERRWGEPYGNPVEAEQADEALALLAIEARSIADSLASLAKPQPVGGADTLRDALVALLAGYGRLKPPHSPKSDAEKQAEAALATLSAPVAQREPMQTTAPHFKWKLEAAISWVRNNYQDHNIGSLCDGIRQAFYAPEIVAVTDDDEIWGLIKGIPFDWTGDSDTLIRYARAILYLAAPAQAAAVPEEFCECPNCANGMGLCHKLEAAAVPEAVERDALIDVARTALEAYENRFESVYGRYNGPIDDEMKALKAAIVRAALSQGEVSGEGEGS